MDQRIIDLYDEYMHVHFDRRIFLEKAARIVGSAAAAAALLPLLKSNYALAAVVPETDSRITTQRITYPGASGPVKAYLAEPKAPGKHGGVVVIHQNRGLNPHIEDIARRLATEGYDAIAVDLLSPQGGTPNDDDKAMAMFKDVNMDLATKDADAAADWLRKRPESNGKIGSMGFCWGGGIVNTMAVTDPNLKAGAAYYGTPPDLADVPKIKAELLLNFADPKLDTRLGQLAPGYEDALKKAKINYHLYFYEGANHAFNDDTQVPRYNADAAKTAWARSMDLFKRNLS